MKTCGTHESRMTASFSRATFVRSNGKVPTATPHGVNAPNEISFASSGAIMPVSWSQFEAES